MKKQILVIHGGDPYPSRKAYLAALKRKKFNFQKSIQKGWKDNLGEKLGPEYQVVMPRMPNMDNARYAEWKIWLDKIIPHLDQQVVLVGHSLGGIFLAKYMAENKFSKRILATLLVAAPFEGDKRKYSLVDFKLKKDLSGLQHQTAKLVFFYSADDKVVPLSDLERYRKKLPGAKYRIFLKRGHFNGASFPEIVREIKKAFEKKPELS